MWRTEKSVHHGGTEGTENKIKRKNNKITGWQDGQDGLIQRPTMSLSSSICDPLRYLRFNLLFAVLFGFFAVLPLAAQPAPKLLPGEGLAIAGEDGQVQGFGEAQREAPMGSLAKLVWLRLEGDDWASQSVRFNCTGTWEGHTCWNREGHKKVDLAKALDQSCNLAFLAWIRESAARWERIDGPGVARYRLEEVFGPFLGGRMPAGEGIPAFGPEWIGDGDLLRTSPEAFLAWLLDPAQEGLMRRWRKLALGFLDGVTSTQAWWMKTGTGPVPGAPGETCAWVAGSNGKVTAVLRLPRGRGRVDGLARFRDVLGIPAK